MTTYYADVRFRVGGDAEGFEEHLDAVLGYLLDDERIVDADLTASLAELWVEFNISTEADDEAQGFEIVSSALRAAIHAADGATPNWLANLHKEQSIIRREDALC